jgi:hypothetical protein
LWKGCRQQSATFCELLARLFFPTHHVCRKEFAVAIYFITRSLIFVALVQKLRNSETSTLIQAVTNNSQLIRTRLHRYHIFLISYASLTGTKPPPKLPQHLLCMQKLLTCCTYKMQSNKLMRSRHHQLVGTPHLLCTLQQSHQKTSRRQGRVGMLPYVSQASAAGRTNKALVKRMVVSQMHYKGSNRIDAIST